ncbi:hypothetical protein [Bacteroides togonis]|uniref:hypothetical protein n=1 Tax=Bacteroides togonis TaxID=1917883 RepID=UPI00094B02EE|nr:hypothetical protein [Bacteroides togonis]
MGIRALVITLLLCFYGYSQNGPNTLHQKEGKIYQLMELDSILMFTGEYDFLLAYVDKHFVFPEVYADASF